MSRRSLLAVFLVAVVCAPLAQAAETTTRGTAAAIGAIDRIRAAHTLSCGGAIRPGLAFPAVDHQWRGLEIDLCRAIATAIGGAGTRVAFTGYANEGDFARAGAADDISFLTGTEIFAHGRFGAVLPGPAIYYEPTQIMVWSGNKAQHVADLRDTMICAEPGTNTERSLQAYMRAHALPFQFSGWQEVEEELDAFDVGRCPAVVGEATALAALRFGVEDTGRHTRLLPEPLAIVPVLATTPAADPAWFATVSWAIETVLASDAGATVQGPRLPVPAAVLASGRDGLLASDWQDRLLRASGSYRALYDANLGAHSPLGLPPGPNEPWSEGGLFAPPVVE